MGAVLLLAAAWIAIVWSRPAPIRIAFANSLTGPSSPAGLESLVATRLVIDARGWLRTRRIDIRRTHSGAGGQRWLSTPYSGDWASIFL